jgi:NADPH-dependent ferric siderophore reductase
MKRAHLFVFGILCLILLIAFGCASVTVTKTAKGYFAPTDPDEIEILVTVPDRANRDFIELATVTTQKWPTHDTAKMHNSLRAKCAPLGANAVILGSSGIDYNGYFWASGVAIRYKD